MHIDKEREYKSALVGEINSIQKNSSLRAKEKHEQQIVLCHKYIEKFSDDWWGFDRLGVLYSREGLFDVSEHYFGRAIEKSITLRSVGKLSERMASIVIADCLDKTAHRAASSFLPKEIGILCKYIAYAKNKYGIFRAESIEGRTIHLRWGAEDALSFSAVFLDREFEPILTQLEEINKLDVFVDLGANVGMVSAFVNTINPNIRIVAIEPDPENYNILTLNTNNSPKISALNIGIGSRQGHLGNIRENAGSLGFQYRLNDTEASSNSIPCKTIFDVLEIANTSKIDLLKVDIEGAEYDLFTTNNSWVENVEAIAAELHDRFVPGCTSAFDQLTHGFEKFSNGEYHLRYRVS